VPKRLSQKLVLSLTIIVIVLAAVWGVVNIKTQERQLLDAMIVGADQLSHGITSATWHAMLRDHRESAFQVMQAIARTQGIDRIRIFNRTGRLMFSTDPFQARDLDKSEDPCTRCHSGVPPKVKIDSRSRVRVFEGSTGHHSLVMITPIYNEKACSGSACHAHPADVRVLGVLDLALDLSPVDREVRAMQARVYLVTGIQILLLSLFVIFFTHHFVTVPIGKLIDGTHAVSAMELDKPVEPIETSEELNELAHSFNKMRERLRDALAEINQVNQGLEDKVERRTEQLKSAHQRLLQSDRMASLGQLAASVAHEVNNPVSTVLNLSMLMQRMVKEDGVPPARLEEFRRYMSIVISETGRVGRIVSDLLSFARRSKPQRSAADLNKVVRTTLSLVAHKLKLAGAEADLDLQSDLPPVECDSAQIQQVIINLVLNAAEAVQRHRPGRIVIRTRTRADAGAVLLAVEDNGEGIAPANLAKIFDPFFTTKPEGKGVGLGLAVTYGIVQAHGGDIEVTSKPGEGTCFSVTLPLAAHPAAAQLPATHTAPPDAGATGPVASLTK
jgi:two-component system NtrC family sensor kinase